MRVRRSPSPRELVANLVACAESENNDGQELRRLLASHSPGLADILGVTAQRHGQASPSLDPESRNPAGLVRLVRLARERQQAVLRECSAEPLTSYSSNARAAGSTMDGGSDRARHLVIVLGRNLLADRTRKYIRFDVEDREPVIVRRAKLYEAGQHPAVSGCQPPAGTCSKLRFELALRKGRAGSSPSAWNRKGSDAVLSVVVQRPRAQPMVELN